MSFGKMYCPSQKLQKKPDSDDAFTSTPIFTSCSPERLLMCHEKLSSSSARTSTVSCGSEYGFPWLELAERSSGPDGVVGIDPPGRRAYCARSSFRRDAPSTLVSSLRTSWLRPKLRSPWSNVLLPPTPKFSVVDR